MQNNSAFKNANLEEKESNKNLFNDMKPVASRSPIKEKKKTSEVKPNQIEIKKGKKRTHKEVGKMEKRPKKSAK